MACLGLSRSLASWHGSEFRFQVFTKSLTYCFGHSAWNALHVQMVKVVFANYIYIFKYQPPKQHQSNIYIYIFPKLEVMAYHLSFTCLITIPWWIWVLSIFGGGKFCVLRIPIFWKVGLTCGASSPPQKNWINTPKEVDTRWAPYKWSYFTPISGVMTLLRTGFCAHLVLSKGAKKLSLIDFKSLGSHGLVPSQGGLDKSEGGCRCWGFLFFIISFFCSLIPVVLLFRWYSNHITNNPSSFFVLCVFFVSKGCFKYGMYSFAFEDDAPWISGFDHFHLGKYENEQGKEHQNMAPKAGKHWQVVVRVIVDMLFWPYCSRKKTSRVFMLWSRKKKTSWGQTKCQASVKESQQKTFQKKGNIFNLLGKETVPIYRLSKVPFKQAAKCSFLWRISTPQDLPQHIETTGWLADPRCWGHQPQRCKVCLTYWW